MFIRVLMLVMIAGYATHLSADFDVVATIREIDPDKRSAVVFANGKQRTVPIADDAKFLDEAGIALPDKIRSSKLNAGATVTLTVERDENAPTIVAIRLGGRTKSPNVSVGKSSVGFTPLTEMTANDRYKGEDGGLYGGGQNQLPEALRVVAEERTSKIQPLDANGNAADDGIIGLVSISMSNATQEFSRFKQIADADSEKSSNVAIVDCAQGGQTMARWADAKANCWNEADRRLERAKVSRQQVQVAWMKLANAGPSGELAEHGKQLEHDTLKVIANLQLHFPNLRIAYLGSRIYGGWADGRLNPEPYAYEGAFVARWLINSQLDKKETSETPPLLLWGPYFWADGLKPRKSDGLIWERSDLVGDGTHPSNTGRQKVAEQLLNFFKSDRHTRAWFVNN